MPIKEMTMPTNEQRMNLLTLARWFYHHQEQFESGDMNLYMGDYTTDALYADGDDQYQVCGSTGCAIGWATEAIAPKSIFKSWTEYSRDLFGEHDGSSDLGQFMFGSEWDLLSEGHASDDVAGLIDRLLYGAVLCFRPRFKTISHEAQAAASEWVGLVDGWREQILTDEADPFAEGGVYYREELG